MSSYPCPTPLRYAIMSMQIRFSDMMLSCSTPCVVLLYPFAVGAGLDVGYPALVFQIPLDGFTNAGVESFGRLPAEFSLYLARVNGVAAIMAGAVRDIGNLFAIALAVRSGAEFVKQCANRVDDVDVGFFVPAADVVDLADFARFQYAANGAAMVFDIEPVTDLLSIAIHWQVAYLRAH